MKKVELIPLLGVPKVKPNDNISLLILEALKRKKINLHNNDVIVIAHKIVSIAENRFVDVASVVPKRKAILLSKKTSVSPEMCQLIIENSKKIIKYKKSLIISENNLGIITANAGIDGSNIRDEKSVILLPVNPNKSAMRIAHGINKNSKRNVGIIISDSVGRPWRYGLTQISIGSFGVLPIKKYKKDLYGRSLYETEVPIIDELASAAGLLMEKDIGVPVVLIRGYNYKKSKKDSNILLRSDKNDIFR
tara:strand:- start:1592 stop:2338 length:747 start_codon:yes stop_codon:yes gene_type:complete